MYTVRFTDRFKKEYKKLDSSMQVMVDKKIIKISEQPQLGKPLHAPLQNHSSERVAHLRIVYTLTAEEITLQWIDGRDHVYH